MKLRAVIAGLLLLAVTPALGAADPALEARYAAFIEQVRCLVCQNESIAESRADLALDLKREIRAQMEAGKSVEEITRYLVARYGDFVLYRPPVSASTGALWAGPYVLLAVAAIGVAVFVRRRARVAAQSNAEDTQ